MVFLENESRNLVPGLMTMVMDEVYLDDGDCVMYVIPSMVQAFHSMIRVDSVDARFHMFSHITYYTP